jgi:hypothetical protein
MSEGRSLEGCAALLGVHPDTLTEWQKVHPEFSGAVRAGRAAATTYGAPGNAQAIQWALRNRSRAASGWHHDSVKLEHSGPDGGPVQVEPINIIDARSLTPQERAQFRAMLEAVPLASPQDEA